METTTLFEDSFVDTFNVLSSTASSIQVGWEIKPKNIPFVRQFQVHYQKLASQYVQYGRPLKTDTNQFEIRNLVADTYYKVCLVVYRTNATDYRECTDASTTNWQLPVSIGSSIGAVLALSVIVLIVLLSRCHIPVKYRRKKSTRANKYDTISSTYPDDQFEFSETATHGNDDDFTSDFDDSAYYEVPVHDHKRQQKGGVTEKPSLHNGLSRGHVHSHSFVHSLQRNSLGRTQCSHPHHHSRQFRAYSIQADGNACFFNQPCSPLAKDPNRSLFTRQYSKQDDFIPQSKSVYTTRSRSFKDYSQPRIDSESNPVHKSSSMHSQAFSYVDEIPEVSSTESSLNSTTPKKESLEQSKPLLTERKLLITDIDFDDIDLSKYGASGGLSNVCETTGKSIEMTSTRRMLALPESVSFDEHTV